MKKIANYSEKSLIFLILSLIGSGLLAADQPFIAGAADDAKIRLNYHAGEPWIYRSPAPGHHAIRDMVAYDRRLVWAVGDSGTILFSGDGGRNRQIQTGADNYHLYAVTLVDSLHLWVCGQASVIYATQDGGAGWRMTPPEPCCAKSAEFFIGALAAADSLTGEESITKAVIRS